MIIGSCTLYKGLQGTRERKRSQGRNMEHRNSRISISDEGVELKTVTNWIISFTGVMADNFLHPLSDFEHIEPSEAILQNMIQGSIIIVNVKLVENHDLRPCRNVLQKKLKSNHESMHAWQNWPQRAGFRGKSCITAICWNNPHIWIQLKAARKVAVKSYLSIKRGLVLVDSDKGQTVVPQFETCGRVKKTTFPQQLTVTVVIFFLLTYHSLKKVKANLA